MCWYSTLPPTGYPCFKVFMTKLIPKKQWKPQAVRNIFNRLKEYQFWTQNSNKGMTDFKSHHFTVVNKLMDLGNAHQWLLISHTQKMTWHYVPPNRNNNTQESKKQCMEWEKRFVIMYLIRYLYLRYKTNT